MDMSGELPVCTGKTHKKTSHSRDNQSFRSVDGVTKPSIPRLFAEQGRPRFAELGR